MFTVHKDLLLNFQQMTVKIFLTIIIVFSKTIEYECVEFLIKQNDNIVRNDKFKVI